MAEVKPATSKPAEVPTPPRSRQAYADSDLEAVTTEMDKIIKYKPPEGFGKPLGKKEKILAAGEFNLSGKTSNLSVNAQALLAKAKTSPKGNKRLILEAKASVEDAIGRAQVAIANGGKSPDKAFYANSTKLQKGLETMARVAYDDQTQRFVRDTIKDLEVISPSSFQYYQKKFLAAKELCKAEEPLNNLAA